MLVNTVLICLTLYCKSKFSSRFINYIKWHIILTDIVIIFWNAVFTPGSLIRHDLDVVVVVDGIFVAVEGETYRLDTVGSGLRGCCSWSLTFA